MLVAQNSLGSVCPVPLTVRGIDLTLARMASERSLRTFVVWPPVVHLQRDDDDTPTDGYGGNSSRFIEAYLGMDER